MKRDPKPSPCGQRFGGAVTEAIARFAVETPRPDLPTSVAHVLRLSLLDWIAVGVAGCGEPVSRIVRKMVLAEGGAGDATVLGTDVRLPARAAALANGATSHALDYDDTHFASLGHPSVVVFPAVLALSEKHGISGADTLDAALIGAEATVRIGAWLGRGHYEHGFHITATAGCIGATAGCARLLGLDAERTAHALGIAATRASGLKSQFGTMGKPYHAGFAASNAVEAATLAAAGFVSRPDALDCAQGFAATHAGVGGGALPMDRWLFEEVKHKFHACCHGTHATVEAAQTARSVVSPEDVAGITVTVHPRYLKVCNIAEPRTGLEAKFSLRHTAAMGLAGRNTAALATFTESACVDPALAALRNCVTIETDAALTETEALVVVERQDGTREDVHHDIAAPLSIEDRQAKVRAKAASLLSEGEARRIWSVIADLPSSGAAFLLADLL